jgi:NAD(P)-dependent dehydrogenase (short-subunit alcohol dehydrogenase family)
MMGGRLTDKVAIVTGGGSGMGAATAMALAREGAHVAVADINRSAAETIAAEIAAAGGQAIAEQVDVARPAEVRRMVEDVVQRWGTVHILACIAGVLRTSSVEDIGEEEWDLVLGVNLKGVFSCAQAVLPAMRAQRAGKIVILASLAGRATSTLGGAHYTASKAGVLGLMRHLARELAPDGIHVNAINPGIIDTPMVRAHASPEHLQRVVAGIPFQRMGRPEEVADLVVFLASDESSYITGTAVDIHGGELII